MGIGSKFTNWVSNAKQGISDSMSNAWNSTKGVAGKVWEGTKTAAKATGNWIENHPELVGNVATGALAAFTSPATALAVRGAVGKIGDSLPEGRVSKFIKRMVGNGEAGGVGGSVAGSTAGITGGTTRAFSTEPKKVNMMSIRQAENEQISGHGVSGDYTVKASGAPVPPAAPGPGLGSLFVGKGSGGNKVKAKKKRKGSSFGTYVHKSSGKTLRTDTDRMVTRSGKKY